MTTSLSAEDRMKKAIIKLQGKQPFFSYLALYLKFYEAKKGDLPDDAGMSVSANGDVYWSKEFVDRITDEEIQSVILHEICHLFLLHLTRRGTREPTAWNVGVDLAVNTILLQNGFRLPQGLRPDNQDEFKIRGKDGKIVTIKKISEKTAEQIYDEIPELPEDENENGYGDGNGNKGFDEHRQGVMSRAEKEKQENEWQKRLSEAYTNSKMKGNLPNGVERYIEELRKSQVNWRALLQKYLQASLPSDQTWRRKSKKSVACRTFMPSTLKEKIDVIISIDTSGSIGKKELTDFLSEIVGLAKAFTSHIDMRLICQDVNVAEDLEVKNGNIEKIMKLSVKGGGGTSHQVVFDYIEEKYKNTKVVIFLTDGYSDLNQIDFEKYKFSKILLISKGGTQEQLKDKNCVTIELKD